MIRRRRSGFGPWFIGRGRDEDNETVWIEAANGGPFRTLAGARDAVRYRTWIRDLVIVEITTVDRVHPIDD